MKKNVYRFLLLVCCCVFAYSVYQLGSIYFEYYQIERETSDIVNQFVVEDTEETPEQEELDPLKRVINFEELLKTNTDVIGWLYIPNTNIDEPILQSDDNDYYLYRTLYKKNSKAGSLFADFRNSNTLEDTCTIIYGHNMKNGSRFHNLRYFMKQDFFTENSKVYVYLPNGEVNEYEIFSAALIDAYDKLYSSTYTYDEFMSEANRQAKFKREVNGEESPLLMLSTCYDTTSDRRYVIFAKQVN